MEEIKIDIMPHRHYTFRHDLNVDRKGIYEEDQEAIKAYEELDNKYYCYELDFFDHTAISFSLVIDRRDLGYYEFDRSKNVGIIAIPKEMVKNGQEARELAREYIDDYNNEINGRDDEER